MTLAEWIAAIAGICAIIGAASAVVMKLAQGLSKFNQMIETSGELKEAVRDNSRAVTDLRLCLTTHTAKINEMSADIVDLKRAAGRQ